MRQVFASPRLENVEGIARFLEEHGIEVRITHGRSYKGGWGGRRTYRDTEGGPQPAVWVVKSEDQPKARQLLREAGLLDSTRAGSDSFLAPSVHAGATEASATPAPQKRAFRYKVALLIAIVVAVALAWSASRKTAAPAIEATSTTAATPTTPTGEAQTPPTTVDAEPIPGAYPVDTPPVLALTLAATELEVQTSPVTCVRIDGAPATAEVLAQMQKLATPVRFDCTDTAGGTLTLDVRGYRTDGSGTGTVELAVTSAGSDGTPSTQVRTLLVRRTENTWRVLRVLAVR
jgi:hypothetical protein